MVDTWCTSNLRLQKNPFLMNTYNQIAVKYKTKEALDKLLNSEPVEKMCPVCGKMKPYMTKGNKEQFGRYAIKM